MQVRYVRMLEMSGPEFEDEIRKAVDEMPALEATSTDSDAESAGSIENTDYPDNTHDEHFSESAADLQRADYASDDDVPDYLSRHMYATSQGSPADYIEPVAPSAGESLIDALMQQLDQQSVTPDERLAAQYIIGNLDDNGYLVRDLPQIADDIAFKEGREFSGEFLRSVWKRVRDLEPAGIGAVDLRDCLLLQLRHLPRTVPTVTATEMIRDYFDLFAKKHFDRIASSMGISMTALQDAIAVVSRLNPKPAGAIDHSAATAARPVIPDFFVDCDDEGNLQLKLLNRIPELSIEQTFASDAPLSGSSEKSMADARVFLRQKRDEATDFIRIVGMRQRTLFTVMSAILRIQRPFFLTEEESQIRPMVLRELAEVTGLDLSVVSRAAQGKYVMTRHGIYPLKMFFNERRRPADDSQTDDSNTAPRISAAIRSVIAAEDKRHPLSDEQITARLREDGFDIARRTVAKYREKLGYPVGRLRKSM